MKEHICYQTGKTKFEDKKSASIRISEIRKVDDSKNFRYYLCKYCGRYHLTTMDKQTHKKIDKSRTKNKKRRREKEVAFWEERLNKNLRLHTLNYI